MEKLSEIVTSPCDINESKEDNEILAQTNNQDVESANQFGDELMDTSEERHELTEEEILDNIFGVAEESFDFDIEPPLNKELAEKFQDSVWSELSEDKKKVAIGELRDVLAEELHLSKIPAVSFFEGSDADCGAFNNAENKLEINRPLLENPMGLVNTLAHEMRHAYQHERADKLETFTDLLFKVNFDNYITPVQVTDSKYLFYMDYYYQYVEADARAYARSFTEAGWGHE